MRREVHVLVALAVALAGNPDAKAADYEDSGECWAKVDVYRDLATARWTADDPTGALMARLDLLAQASRCGDANAEQIAAIQVGFENVFVQVADGAELSELQGADVHRWYDDFMAHHAAAAAELADTYHRFSEKIRPPVRERVDDPQHSRPVVPEASKSPPLPSRSEGPETVPLPSSRASPPRALMIGGASVLALGLGIVAVGFVSVGRAVAAQRELNEHCAITCGDADTTTQLLVRGQFHETLAPALLASGALATVAGVVLLGLGVRKHRSPLVAPILHPQFTGASWTVRF